MRLFGLFGPPNIQRLQAKRDVRRLLEALSYLEDRQLRAQAVIALGQIGDPRAVEPLTTILKDEVLTRAAAAAALGAIGDQRAVEPLCAALSDSDKDLRLAAAEALARLGWKPDSDRAATLYSIAARDWSQCCRIGAAAVEPLCVVLEDSDAAVRSEAAVALGRMGDERAVAPLVAVVKEDEDPRVRSAAASALVNLGAQAALLSVLEGDRSCSSLKARLRAYSSLEPILKSSALDAARQGLIDDAASEIRRMYSYTRTVEDGYYDDFSTPTMARPTEWIVTSARTEPDPDLPGIARLVREIPQSLRAGVRALSGDAKGLV